MAKRPSKTVAKKAAKQKTVAKKVAQQKTVAKKAAKQKTAAKKVTKQQNIGIVYALPDPETSLENKTGGAKTPRRDDSAAAERALSGKFPHVAAERFSTMRNQDGDTPCDLVKRERRNNPNRKAYRTTQFWVSLTLSFNFAKRLSTLCFRRLQMRRR